MKQYWRKYIQAFTKRLSRLRGSPTEIAAGVACGVAISCTPFVGIHILLAVALAWLIRANITAAALGTISGNPWTFPFIWLLILTLGRLILRLPIDDKSVDFAEMFAKIYKALINSDFSLFFDEIWPILWPMIVGSIPLGIAVWVLTYYALKKMLVHPIHKKEQQNDCRTGNGYCQSGKNGQIGGR
jgi:uncharacterized protein (DUF2062 family)